MVYIMMGVSMIIGFCFGTGIFVSGTESILYSTGVLIESRTWGWMLLFTATCAQIGFLRANKALTAFGGLGGFMLWTLATIDATMAGHVYIILTVTLFHALFHGYVYLASSLNVLRRS